MEKSKFAIAFRSGGLTFILVNTSGACNWPFCCDFEEDSSSVKRREKRAEATDVKCDQEVVKDVEMAEEENGSGGNLPEIELIIKASTIDGRRKGACLFCQVMW